MECKCSWCEKSKIQKANNKYVLSLELMIENKSGGVFLIRQRDPGTWEAGQARLDRAVRHILICMRDCKPWYEPPLHNNNKNKTKNNDNDNNNNNILMTIVKGISSNKDINILVLLIRKKPWTYLFEQELLMEPICFNLLVNS